MRYVFRADASKVIGAGHVMRISAIAEELIELKDCERWYRREQEAYAIQKRFLEIVGSQIRVAYSQGQACDP